jgi:lysophospholipase L1-like esterase
MRTKEDEYMDRPISIRGNRLSVKNIKDVLSQKDITGVYTLYSEYYDDKITEFVNIELVDKDENDNYPKAIYRRYDKNGNIVENRDLSLIYDDNTLIDIDDYTINNDFFTNDRLEFIIYNMVNVNTVKKIKAQITELAGVGRTVETVKDNLIQINNLSQQIEETNSQVATLTKQWGYRFAAIGDSITNGNSGAGSAGDDWFPYVCYRLKGKIITNAGVIGNTTAQMLARIQTDVIDKKPDVCFINGGTNDSGTLTPQETFANIQAICLALSTAKIKPILLNVTPRNDSTKNAWIIRLNMLTHRFASRYGIPYIDFYSALVDPTTGYIQAAYTADGLHPNTAGKRAMADTIVNTIGKYFWDINYPITAANVDNTNLIANGLFLNDADSNGTPDNWTVSGTTGATYSLEADANIKGNWLKIVRTTADQSYIKQDKSTGFNIGDVLNVSGKFKAENAISGGMVYSIFLYFSGPGSSPGAVSSWTADVTDGVFNKDIVVPDGTTQISIRILTKDGTGTLYVSQIALRNLTTGGLLDD